MPRRSKIGKLSSKRKGGRKPRLKTVLAKAPLKHKDIADTLRKESECFGKLYNHYNMICLRHCPDMTDCRTKTQERRGQNDINELTEIEEAAIESLMHVETSTVEVEEEDFATFPSIESDIISLLLAGRHTMEQLQDHVTESYGTPYAEQIISGIIARMKAENHELEISPISEKIILINKNEKEIRKNAKRK